MRYLVEQEFQGSSRRRPPPWLPHAALIAVAYLWTSPIAANGARINRGCRAEGGDCRGNEDITTTTITTGTSMSMPRLWYLFHPLIVLAAQPSRSAAPATVTLAQHPFATHARPCCTQAPTAHPP